jgi:hypothetical protein
MPTTYWTEEEVEEHTRLAVKRAVEHERQECWELINRWIKTGKLPFDAHERRNGIILAANLIRERMKDTTDGR